jgi:phospholipid/cholesterol/gamma-HCH transport system permease protein
MASLLRLPSRASATAFALVIGAVEAFGASLLLLAGAITELARALARPDRFSRRQTVEALFRAAIKPLPLVGILSILLGAILGLAIASAFAVAHVERLLLPILRQILLRQALPMLIGLVVIGQAGLTLVTRLSAMQASGEADTLRALGIRPTDWVLPTALLEFLVLAAMQFFWGAFVAQLAASLILLAEYGIPVSHYVGTLAVASARENFWTGFARCEVFALYGWMVAATTGALVAGSRDDTARATGITFVASLLGLLTIAALFTWAGA